MNKLLLTAATLLALASVPALASAHGMAGQRLFPSTLTIDDPKAYTRPWTVEMNQKITLDTELIDEMCLENEKSSQRMRGK